VGVDVPEGTLSLPPSLSVPIDGSEADRMFDRAARRPHVAERDDEVAPNVRSSRFVRPTVYSCLTTPARDQIFPLKPAKTRTLPDLGAYRAFRSDGSLTVPASLTGFDKTSG
jgi:hypothetical protein